jgi:hypothetical protein
VSGRKRKQWEKYETLSFEGAGRRAGGGTKRCPIIILLSGMKMVRSVGVK